MEALAPRPAEFHPEAERFSLRLSLPLLLSLLKRLMVPKSSPAVSLLRPEWSRQDRAEFSPTRFGVSFMFSFSCWFKRAFALGSPRRQNPSRKPCPPRRF